MNNSASRIHPSQPAFGFRRVAVAFLALVSCTGSLWADSINLENTNPDNLFIGNNVPTTGISVQSVDVSVLSNSADPRRLKTGAVILVAFNSANPPQVVGVGVSHLASRTTGGAAAQTVTVPIFMKPGTPANTNPGYTVKYSVFGRFVNPANPTLNPTTESSMTPSLGDVQMQPLFTLFSAEAGKDTQSESGKKPASEPEKKKAADPSKKSE